MSGICDVSFPNAFKTSVQAIVIIYSCTALVMFYGTILYLCIK